MESSNLYINEQGELCVHIGCEMLVTAFGSCPLGEYMVYTPKKD